MYIYIYTYINTYIHTYKYICIHIRIIYYFYTYVGYINIKNNSSHKAVIIMFFVFIAFTQGGSKLSSAKSGTSLSATKTSILQTTIASLIGFKVF